MKKRKISLPRVPTTTSHNLAGAYNSAVRKTPCFPNFLNHVKDQHPFAAKDQLV